MSSSGSDDGPPSASHGADADDASQNAPVDSAPRPPPRKRKRTVISCTECHRRKQKCDRRLPCTNCVSRNKEGACRYETGAPTARDHSRKHSKSGGLVSPDPEPVVDSIPTKVANFGYSRTGASILGFLQKIEGADPNTPLANLQPDGGQHGDGGFNTRERYKSLIRLLPARNFIDKLVDIFFRSFNWQYSGLDRDVFDKQLAEWYRLPFNLLTIGGPQALSPDLRVFPGLLFQVLATALLVLSSNTDPLFDSLKYAGNMTFEDLAVDYSESGVSVLSLLGKRQMTLTTVLAGFLRASFLKYVALVTEAWHAIGSTIRDAQEIGIHRDSQDPKPKGDSAEAILENQWEIQRRRRIWMILIGWDTHTGAVLGRPTTINFSAVQPTLPIDAPAPKDRSRTPVLPREEDDPPTTLTRAIWAYHVMAPLRDILELEKEGPSPKDFSKVDMLHQRLIDVDAQTPAWFRLENPDTRYDDHPDCYWLPSVRATMPQLMMFNQMALHRPYIFTRPHSRTEALKASLGMLHAQRLHFKSLQPHQYKTFSLFFGTFDAIVLMASIYILFPREHPEMVQNALQHFVWAVDRFEAMSERNALAKAALGVLRAIHMRLKKSLGISASACANGKPTLLTPSTTEDSTSASLSPFPFSPRNTLNPSNGTTFAPSPNPFNTDAIDPALVDPATTTTVATGFDWTLPSNFDWASLQPIYATSDLLYNDLMGIRDDSAMVPASSWGMAGDSGGGGVPQESGQGFQFEGGFGDDSVWSLLNHYVPM
ncbi:fungal-specific transcription factor domain-containing protein [Lasiosphaeria hispida]|uniref:Fungal-specific transcription factor domain-containing protein n=1 Tax=Lasiosphaeria hispida TaxID=260671 RepID=A0AAJ0H9B5_9PEZI|nr:fungal-specific transcription factor domain-containing protein [Lasiosphaeria hispida]